MTTIELIRLIELQTYRNGSRRKPGGK